MTLSLIETWIVSKLTAAPAVTAIVGSNIFVGEAPSSATYPLVLVQFTQDAVYTNSQMQSRDLLEALYQVEGIVQDETFHYTLDAAIDAALQVVREVYSGQVVTSLRERPVSAAYSTHGRPYRHAGGRYRIYVR